MQNPTHPYTELLKNLDLFIDETKDATIASYEKQYSVETSKFTFKRKKEFLSARACAHRALEKAGFVDKSFQIKIGTTREPLWPTGYTGSITHTHGTIASVVGKKTVYRSIGIDSEMIPNKQTLREIRDSLLTETELRDFPTWLDQKPEFDESQLLTLVFSAKESLYKALFPLTSVFFEFQDAELFLTNGRFQLRLLQTLSPQFPKQTVIPFYSFIGSLAVHTVVLIKI